MLDWSTGIYNPRVDITRDTTTLYASDRDVFLFLVDDLNPIEAGPRGRLIYLAAYKDYDKREGQLLGLEADPSWQSVQREASSAIVEAATTILNPTAFSPIRTRPCGRIVDR